MHFPRTTADLDAIIAGCGHHESIRLAGVSETEFDVLSRTGFHFVGDEPGNVRVFRLDYLGGLG